MERWSNGEIAMSQQISNQFQVQRSIPAYKGGFARRLAACCNATPDLDMTSRKTISLGILLLLLVNLAAIEAQEGEEITAGEAAATEAPAGDAAKSEATAGEGAPGETTAGGGVTGETTAGEGAPGETTAGEGAPGETPGGEGAQGETTAADGAPGETTTGAASETAVGDGAPGETSAGENGAPGETAAGENGAPGEVTAGADTTAADGATTEKPAAGGAADESTAANGASSETPAGEGTVTEKPSGDGATTEKTAAEGTSKEKPAEDGSPTEMPAEGAKPTGDSGEVENVAALGAEQGDAGNQTTTDGSKAAPDSSKGAAEDEKDSKEEKAEKGEEDTTSKDPFYYGNGSPTTLDDAQTPGTNPTLPPETTTTTGIMDLMTYMPEDNAGDPFVSPGAAHRPGSRHVKAHDGFHSLTTEQYWAHWNDRFTTKKSRNGHHWRDLMQ